MYVYKSRICHLKGMFPAPDSQWDQITVFEGPLVLQWLCHVVNTGLNTNIDTDTDTNTGQYWSNTDLNTGVNTGMNTDTDLNTGMNTGMNTRVKYFDGGPSNVDVFDGESGFWKTSTVKPSKVGFRAEGAAKNSKVDFRAEGAARKSLGERGYRWFFTFEVFNGSLLFTFQLKKGPLVLTFEVFNPLTFFDRRFFTFEVFRKHQGTIEYVYLRSFL